MEFGDERKIPDPYRGGFLNSFWRQTGRQRWSKTCF